MNTRVAVVTGSAGGIGSAIVDTLIEQGWAVVGFDVAQDPLERQADRLRAVGRQFTARAVDVSQAVQVADAFAAIGREHGGLDALVNNAGTCLMHDFVEITPDELRRQMAVNFDSAFYCCQQAIPLLLGRGATGEKSGASGRVAKIVNISSNGAYNFDVFDPAHYRASKAALDNLTKHLARRYAAEGLAVNSIAPAMTRTPLFDVVPADVLDKAIAGMPRGAPMQPSEIAAWVAFLLSPAGDCASGNVIILNQGRDVR